MCPYCPYNKIPYDSSLAEPYSRAIRKELDLLSRQMGQVEIDSIYIGGGTPTTLINELGPILEHTRRRFSINGPVCLETSPAETSREIVGRLRECGIDLVSLGVESFDNHLLSSIGRNYDSKAVYAAIGAILEGSFQSVNLDLLFALPGQTVGDVLADLREAEKTGANQLTLYPLFAFPYSSVGRYLKLKSVGMPPLGVRRRMYGLIYDYLVGRGFRRVSVWSFNRTDSPRYSSVTRNDYVGLGAGAGSHLPGAYYLNTFSPKAYIDCCLSGKLPRALEMAFTPTMEKYYWLYWRLYDTYIPRRQLTGIFGEQDSKVSWLLPLMRMLHLTEDIKGTVSLTKRGAFWIHLLQNYFSLNYINKVWTLAQSVPWPDRIEI